jgi:hypothetical protein
LELSPEYLRAVRGCALRKRVWYRALDGVERGIADLTLALVDRVKSLRLAEAIAGILEKLETALRSEFTRHVEAYGYGKMRDVIRAAMSLGNRLAGGWATEPFARLLALNDMYSPPGWRQPA